MSRAPARRAVLALTALVLAAGCSTTITPPEEQGAASSTATTSGDARSYELSTREILQQAYAMVEASDKPALSDQKAPWTEAVCSIEEANSATAWTEVVFLPVDSTKVEAARVRQWLFDEGYEQVRSRQDGAITSHQLDGYTVTVAEWKDGRVELNVESPCV